MSAELVIERSTCPDLVLSAGTPGTTDHGALSGLNDDDHTQYQLRSEQSQPNGYPSLDGSALVPSDELATGTADNTTFLRGDGTWAVPPGGGVGSIAEEFVQAAPLATWTVNHTLGFRPAVTVIDGTGTRIYPQVDYVGATQVVISHSLPETGTVLLS